MSKNITVQQNSDSENKEILQDYLDLIRCSYPYCNCGTCILRKNKKLQINSDYSYGKGTKSMYRNQFLWNTPEKNTQNDKQINKETNKGRLDIQSKDHLKSGYVSIMKNDYKSIPTEVSEQIIQSGNFKSNSPSPFLGRSNYSIMYPNWEVTKNIKKKPDEIISQNIPFSGKSSYKENYERFEKRFYIDRPVPILKKDNIEINGRILTETTNKETFKPIDYNKVKDFNGYSDLKHKSLVLTAPYCKDSFLSSYEKAFMFHSSKNKNMLSNLNTVEKN